MTRIRAQANWMAMGMRYEPVSLRSLVALSTIEAMSRPMVIAS